MGSESNNQAQHVFTATALRERESVAGAGAGVELNRRRHHKRQRRRWHLESADIPVKTISARLTPGRGRVAGRRHHRSNSIRQAGRQADSCSSCCGFGTAFLCQVLSSVFKRFAAAESAPFALNPTPCRPPVCVCVCVLLLRVWHCHLCIYLRPRALLKCLTVISFTYAPITCRTHVFAFALTFAIAYAFTRHSCCCLPTPAYTA